MSLATDHDTNLESHLLYILALEKIDRNKYKDALDHMTDALRMVPTNPIYLSYFGLCLAHAEGDYGRAIRVCHHALQILSKDPIIRVNLGKVYRLKGDRAAAYRHLIRAHELNKRNPTTAVELTRMGIRRPPFFTFLHRGHLVNKYLGMLRATLERKLIGQRQS